MRWRTVIRLAIFLKTPKSKAIWTNKRLSSYFCFLIFDIIIIFCDLFFSWVNGKFIFLNFLPGYLDMFGTLRSSCLYRQHSRTLKSICSDLQCWPGMKQQLHVFWEKKIDFFNRFLFIFLNHINVYKQSFIAHSSQ